MRRLRRERHLLGICRCFVGRVVVSLVARDVDLVTHTLLITYLRRIVIVVYIVARWTQYLAAVFDHGCALLVEAALVCFATGVVRIIVKAGARLQFRLPAVLRLPCI